MKNYLRNLFSNLSDKLDYLKNEEVIFNFSKTGEHGDLSTNIAMRLEKKSKKIHELLLRK